MNSLELGTHRDEKASAQAESRLRSATAMCWVCKAAFRKAACSTCPAPAFAHPPRSFLGADRSIAGSPKAGGIAFRNPSCPQRAPALADRGGQMGLCHTRLQQQWCYNTGKGVLNAAVSQEQREHGDSLLAVPGHRDWSCPASRLCLPCLLGWMHLCPATWEGDTVLHSRWPAGLCRVVHAVWEDGRHWWSLEDSLPSVTS